MIIQCDADNVLNNLMETVLMLFNNDHNTNYTKQDLTTYDLENCLPREDAMAMKKIFSDPMLWSVVRPLKGAQESIKKLIQLGHDVYIVTNNDPRTFGEKYDWIKYYFPFVNDSNIICSPKKWIVKCDVLIEDCYENLIEKPYFDRVLIDYPWNQSTKDDIYGIYRCKNWSEISDAINVIKNNLE